MWNPTVGLGTVTHEYIGYLLPDGALLRRSSTCCGVPVWVAQRLWLGSILFAAGVGHPLPLSRILGLRGPGPVGGRAGLHALAVLPAVRRAHLGDPAALGRPAVHAGPHHRGPAAGRLARAGALRRRGGAGERHQRQLHHLRRRRARSSGSSTPWSSCARRPGATRSATALRIGVLTLGACLWWIAGLEVEAAYGVNVLKYTETVPSTSATSNAAEVIRGLGYWYFYGSDHLGPWTNAAVRYTQEIWLLATSYAVPGRSPWWRPPSCAGASGPSSSCSLFVGLVLSVGPFPFTHPTADRRRAQGLHDRHHGGWPCARPTGPRRWCCWPWPCCSAAALTALWRRVPRRRARHRRRSWPAWSSPTTRRSSTATSSPTTSPSRPRCPPTSWRPSTTSTPPTRAPGCFAIPGNDFAAYRWGDTVDTPQPALPQPGLRHPRAADHGLHRHRRHPLRRRTGRSRTARPT